MSVAVTRVDAPAVSRLDRMIAAVSPAWGMRRMAARARLDYAGKVLGYGYVGGGTGSKSMQNWAPGQGDAYTDHIPQQGSLRGRTRDLARNSAVGTGALGTSVTSVVGTGLRPQSQIDAELLGLTEAEAEAWQTRAERIWRAAAPTLDWEGELGLGERQALAFRAMLDSGDVLVIKRYRVNPGDFLGGKIQFVESDRVSNPNNIADTDRLTAGVQTDENGRTEGWWVSARHPGDFRSIVGANDWTFVPAYTDEGIRVGRLLFETLRPGQRRGIPFLAPIVEQIKQLARLSEAELMGAVVASLFTVFIKAEGAPELGSPFADGEVGLTSGRADAATDHYLNPGSVVSLNRGESIDTASPGRPNDAFDPFFTSIVRQIGMSLEIPFEILLKHFSSSYSASRGAFLEAWRRWKVRRHWLAENFCSLEYEMVISEAVAAGLLAAPGYFTDPVIRHAYLRAHWVGDSPGHLDEVRAANAARIRVEEGFSTRTREARQMTGMDFDTVVATQARERRVASAAGVTVGGSTDASGPAPLLDEGDNE